MPPRPRGAAVAVKPAARALLLAALFLPVLSPARAQDDEPTPISRSLAGLELGQKLKSVRSAYPPTKEWPSAVRSRVGVTRFTVQHGDAKNLPDSVNTLYLGFNENMRLVEIEVVYDVDKSRAQSVEKSAGEFALVYGAPRRTDERYWWSDGKTVLRVFPAEIPVPGKRATSWRTAVQIFDRRLTDRAE